MKNCKDMVSGDAGHDMNNDYDEELFGVGRRRSDPENSPRHLSARRHTDNQSGLPETSFADATSVRPMFEEDHTKRSLQEKKGARNSGRRAPSGFNTNQLSSSGDFELTASNPKRKDGNSTQFEESLSPALGPQEDRQHTCGFADTRRGRDSARDSVRDMESKKTSLQVVESSPSPQIMSFSGQDEDPRYKLCTCWHKDTTAQECQCIDPRTGVNTKLVDHIQKARDAA